MIEGAKDAVLCIGSVMVDNRWQVPRVPLSGEGVVVQSASRSLGGCAFNSANAVRQLGMRSLLFAPIGVGPNAQYSSEKLAELGFHSYRVPTECDCGSCVCLVEPTGERTMLTLAGVERRFESSWFDELDASSAAFGIVSGYEIEGEGGSAIIGFFERNSQLRMVFAPGPRICGIDAGKMARIKALRPLWHLNDLELFQFTRESSLETAGMALSRSMGVPVVVTEGSHGAHLFAAQGSVNIGCSFDTDTHIAMSTEPVCVVDTIGAGDSHVGALVAGLTAGLNWDDALSLANMVAGAVCRVSGAALSDEEFAAFALPSLA